MDSKKPTKKTSQATTTRGKLLELIEAYLAAANKGCPADAPRLTPEAFGWAAIKDSYLVTRLRNGGDITTGKLDAVIKYLSNPTK